MIFRSIVGAVLVLGLVACAAPYKTDFDYDREGDFSRYRSWSWISDKPMITSDGVVGNPLWQNRIMFHIEKAMTAKGYRMIANREAADFVVSFTIGSRDKVQVNSYPATYHAGWGRGWGYGYYGFGHVGTEVDVREYTEGQLAIDVFDVSARRPVWHGFATGNVRKNRDQAEREELLKQIVADILDHFPPA